MLLSLVLCSTAVVVVDPLFVVVYLKLCFFCNFLFWLVSSRNIDAQRSLSVRGVQREYLMKYLMDDDYIIPSK